LSWGRAAVRQAAELTKSVSRQSIATKLESERLMVFLLDDEERKPSSRDQV
jgi:hypothetical protein